MRHLSSQPLNRSRMMVAVAVAVGLGTAGCAGSSAGGVSPGGGRDESGEIIIGVLGPLSGDSASAGQDIVHGAELAAKTINDAGGVDGKKIKIVSQDDACSAQTAAQAAQKLISQKVIAVAGGYCSAAAFPAVEAFHRVGVPFVMDGTTNPQLTEQGYAESFRTIFRDDFQGPFAAKYITDFLKAKKVAVVHDNTTYSKGLADQTVTALKVAGADVVYNNAVTPGQSDYSSVLTRVAQTKPEVFYYTGYYAEFGLLLKQARQVGLKVQMMGGDATNDATLMKTAGKAAEGALVDTAPLAQFLSSAKGYVQAYKSAYGTTPGPYSAYEYDAVGVIAAGIKKAKSTDPKKITEALHNLGDFEGITGKFHFDPKGDRKPVSYIVITVKDGVFADPKKFDETSGKWVDAS